MSTQAHIEEHGGGASEAFGVLIIDRGVEFEGTAHPQTFDEDGSGALMAPDNLPASIILGVIDVSTL